MEATEPKVGVVYARVSAIDHRDEGSLETQVNAALEFASNHDIFAPPVHVLKENARGTDPNRSRLNRFQQLVREQKTDYLIVSHPDRLARIAADLMALKHEISESDVELMFAHGPNKFTPDINTEVHHGDR